MSTIGFGLMCKPPRPGTSKTRLAAGIGNAAAARLSAAFLQDCAAAAVAAGAMTALKRRAFYRPADAADELRTVLGPDWPLHFADAGDLGATMRDILAGLLQHSPAGAMIMGADIPMIQPAMIATAAAALRNSTKCSVVIAPTRDGGYCLIGVRSMTACASLFDPMAWSTTDVFQETRRRAQASGLQITELEAQRDIDDADDLTWLRGALQTASDHARATRLVMAELRSSPLSH